MRNSEGLTLEISLAWHTADKEDDWREILKKDFWRANFKSEDLASTIFASCTRPRE